MRNAEGPWEDDLAQRVWNLMTGVYCLDFFEPREAVAVRNEFDEDSDCSRFWDAVCAAEERLGTRLGTDPSRDPDIDAMMSNYESLMHRFGLKMFEYGRLFAGGKES